MHRLGVKLALNDDIGVGEALLYIAVLEDEVIGDVRGLFGVPVAAGAKQRACHSQQALMQDRGVIAHSVEGVQRRAQYFILYINQRRRFFG